jgi:hypothetical protein
MNSNQDTPQFQVLERRLPRRRRRASLWTWLFLLLLVSLVILGVVNLAILGVKAVSRPGKPVSGDLIYATTFDGPNPEWDQRTQGQDRYEITNHMLRLTIDKGAFSPLDLPLTDFDLRINALRIAQDDDSNEMGVLFHLQDAQHYYMFRIRGDGAYRVELCQDCVGNPVNVLSEWQKSPAILAGVNQTNTLRIVVKGDQFQFYVNDQLLLLCPKGSDRRSTWTGLDTGQCLSNGGKTVDTLVDSTLSDGKIGLGVTTDSTEVQIGFTNMLIYGPQ